MTNRIYVILPEFQISVSFLKVEAQQSLRPFWGRHLGRAKEGQRPWQRQSKLEEWLDSGAEGSTFDATFPAWSFWSRPMIKKQWWWIIPPLTRPYFPLGGLLLGGWYHGVSQKDGNLLYYSMLEGICFYRSIWFCCFRSFFLISDWFVCVLPISIVQGGMERRMERRVGRWRTRHWMCDMGVFLYRLFPNRTKQTWSLWCGVMEGPKDSEHTSFWGEEYSNLDPGSWKFHTFFLPKFHCFGCAICLFGLDFLPGKDDFLTSKL